MGAPRKLPSGKWIVQIRYKGQKAVSKTFSTKLEAERWMVDQKERLGKTPEVTARKTFIDAIERYRKEVTPLHKGQHLDELRLNCVTFMTLHFMIYVIAPLRIWRKSCNR